MVWINTNFLLFGGEWELANLKGFQLMMRLKVRPSPDTTVNHVW